jgi:hypothetical protein
MRERRSLKVAAIALPVSTALGGCSLLGAPSLYLFGAYFPAWMLSGLVAVVVAIAARGVFIATGQGFALPYQFLLCVSIGVITALVFWLLGFGL